MHIHLHIYTHTQGILNASKVGLEDNRSALGKKRVSLLDTHRACHSPHSLSLVKQGFNVYVAICDQTTEGFA